MTEDEARAKWCPMVRIMREGIKEMVPTNRADGGVAEADHCIASDCMMWRWDYAVAGMHPNKLSDVHGDCGLKR